MLKLFVVGSASPIPSEWDDWDEIELVIAMDKDEAVALSSQGSKEVVEIPFTKSMLIYSSPSPELWHGNDT